jgi:regulator of replication initiation timing
MSDTPTPAAPEVSSSETTQTPTSVTPPSTESPQTPISTTDSSSSESWLDRLDSVFEKEPSNESKSGDSETESTEDASKTSEDAKTEDEDTETETEAETEPETETKNMSVEARRAFKEFRVKNRELAKQLGETQAELNKLKETPSEKSPDTTQLAEENKVLKERLQEATSELSTVAVEATPEYKEQVIKPLVDTLRSVGALSERYNVSKRLLERAIEESAEAGAPSEELTDAASAMSGFDQQELHLLVRGMRSVMERKAWYQNNSQAIADHREREMSERQSAFETQRKEATLAAAENVWSKLSELPPIKSIPPEDLKKAYTMAKNSVADLDKAPEDLRSYSAFAAALLPNILKQVKVSQAKVKELEGSLAKYTKSKPKAGAGSSDGGISAAPEGLSFLDAIEAGVGR